MAFEPLRSSFKGDLTVPSDAEYPQAIARWAVNAQRPAKVVAFVRDSADVVTALKYASEQKLPIAIRGGGHSVAGASSSDDGLVIDLSRYLHHVRVDTKEKRAYVGGGALWETVDKTAIKHGLATVAGTVNHTGVGGLLLGGGFGYLAPKHGLVIDNLVQASVVTASGDVLTANDTENSDLFWAIRGGGSNFGVCTEFVLKLHPQRAKVYAGMVHFASSTLQKVLSAVDQWWTKGPSVDEAVLQFFSRGPDGKPFIGLVLFHNGSEEAGRDVFRTILELGPTLDTTSEIPYESLNALLNPIAAPGRNIYMKSVHVATPKPDIIQDVFNEFVNISEHDSPALAFNVVYEYYPNTNITQIPNNATAFGHRRPGIIVLAFGVWAENTPERQVAAKEGANQILGLISQAEKKIDEKVHPGYGNYDSEVVSVAEADRRSKALFGENYARLKQLKNKYDPELVFSKWFPISPTI